MEANTTMCPVCNFPLSRVDGCAHLTCLNCKSKGQDTHVCDFCGKQIFGATNIELYSHFTNNTSSELNFERDRDPTHFTKRKIILRNKHGKVEGDRIYDEELKQNAIQEQLEKTRLDMLAKHRSQIKAQELADAKANKSSNSTGLKTAHVGTGYIPLNYKPSSDAKIEERNKDLQQVKALQLQKNIQRSRARAARKARDRYDEDDHYDRDPDTFFHSDSDSD